MEMESFSSFRKDYINDNVEIQIGHVPSYDEEQESEIGVFDETKQDK